MPWLSHFLTEQRTHKVLPYVSGSVLDIGCGIHPLVPYLAPGQYYVGVERETRLLTRLGREFPRGRYMQCDLNRQPLPLEEQFDTIVLMAVIEHLDDPARVIAQLPRLLRRDGRLIMTTPTPIGNWMHHWAAKVHWVSEQAAEEHNVIFDRKTITKTIETAGLRLMRYEPFLLGGNQLVVASL